MHHSILFTVLQSKMDYLDPGSGSMLVQMILAAALGIGVGVKIFWKQIRAFFTHNKAEENLSEDPTEIVDDPTALPDEKTDLK